jgi:site-specific DNA recombinase
MKKRSASNSALSTASAAPLVRCAIYTRVSTDDQARGEYNSLESQRDICEHAIAVHLHEGWKTTLYLDDPGYSGKNLERPGMQALIQEVKAGQVDVVVAYKLDRITRYLPDFYEFWKILNEHKVNFVSATQAFDTSTPMGMLMLNMLLSFGQFEREMIAERVSHKIAERAKKGLWNGGWAPLGYAHDPVTKQILPDPAEAPIARRVFELSKELRSAAKVAGALNAEGLRTPERTVKSRRGNEMVVGGKRFIPNKI